jgi:hypothetical protein
MRLSEALFTEIVDAGCPKCGSKRVTVETYVAQKLPLMGGEPYGAPSWGYKGEELVHGTYRIACTACDHELFADAGCPRCDAANGLERALETENAFPLPTKCLGCGSELLSATAYVPATVAYEGKRGAKARTQTAPEDAGFHAFSAECKQCRQAAARSVPCALCG